MCDVLWLNAVCVPSWILSHVYDRIPPVPFRLVSRLDVLMLPRISLIPCMI